MASTHANRGKELERLIEASLKQRPLYWQRNHPKTTYANVRGRLQAFPSGDGPPDYLVATAGLTWLIEAKSFKGTRWQFDGLAKHQADALDLAEAQAGAIIGGVIIGQFTESDRLIQAWWLSWRTLGPLWRRWQIGMADRGQAGLSVTELQALGAALSGCDFLPAALTERG